MRPEGVSTLRVVRAVWIAFMAQASTCSAAPASLRATAHSRQHTSTDLPPMLTVMAALSSGQSHAAQVLSDMGLSPFTINIDRWGLDRMGRCHAVRIFSDMAPQSLASSSEIQIRHCRSPCVASTDTGIVLEFQRRLAKGFLEGRAEVAVAGETEVKGQQRQVLI